MTLLRRGSGLVEWRVSFVSLFHLKDITFGEFFNIYFSCFEIIFIVESDEKENNWTDKEKEKQLLKTAKSGSNF
jgi:hypothetical protein